MKLLFFQYGDYGAAYCSLSSGGAETYRDQKHSVDYVASLAATFEVTTVAICDRPHDERVAKDLRSIGITVSDAYSSKVRTLLDELSPDLMVCRTPHRGVLEWAAKQRVPVLPAFADIFDSHTVRHKWENWRLGAVLRKCKAPAVSNHSLVASQSLSRLGVTCERIVPWDFNRIEAIEPAKSRSSKASFSLFYAGMIVESKGVGDLISAVAECHKSHVNILLTLAGPGDEAPYRRLAEELGIADSVTFAGVISVQSVLQKMRGHDAVVVPSRHSYAEGLPNTIFEALASRSPLIASDHPAYASRLSPGEDSLCFKSGMASDLASCILSLIEDSELYERISINSTDTLAKLYCGIEWSKLVGLFVEDPRNQTGWVNSHSLVKI